MIAVGVDSHKDRHVAVAIDDVGLVLGEVDVQACLAGYAALAAWAAELGDDVVFGIEGAGSYGAGLCEYLTRAGCRVLEVERPKRAQRRTGKSDRIDALAAAKRVLGADGLSTPRAHGTRRALAAVLTAHRSVTIERTRVLNQLHALHTTAPIAVRERVGKGSGDQLAARLATMRARPTDALEDRIVLGVLRDLARRARTLKHQARGYERELSTLVKALDATLLNERGIGPISAAKLLACDPTRFTSEAAFARCNGTAPLPASSGKTVRHRLSRAGDRQVNNAIHTIALSRANYDADTRAYLERRITEEKTRREAMRCLKRHLSRSLYKRLTTTPLTS